MKKKTWVDYTSNFLEAVFIMVCICCIGYFIYYWVSANNQGMIPEHVDYLNEWEYSIDGGNTWEKVDFPCKLDIDSNASVEYRSNLPLKMIDGEWFTTLNSRDIVVYINDVERFSWKRDDGRIPGGPAKPLYMFIPLNKFDEGQEVRIVKSGHLYNGSMERVLVGDSLSITNELKRTTGSLQLFIALFLLISSAVIIIIGVLLKKVYGNNIKMIPLGIGVMCTSSWLILDSNAFQLITGIGYIDGFLSYIITLIMVFPFIAYIDILQKHKYRKLYMPLAIIQFVSFLVCTVLHMSGLFNFSRMLNILDLIIAWIAIVVLICTVIDMSQGAAEDYKIVALGFLVFGILCVVEISFLNLDSIVRVDGSFILIGLFALMIFAIMQQVEDINKYQKLKLEEEDANRARTEFLTNMSHEIRTPINTILGMNEMIQQENCSPKIKEYSERIGHSGLSLLSLVDDVLDYSVSQTKEIEIVNRDYKVKNLIDDATSVLKVSAAEKGLSVNIGLPAMLPEFLNGDEKHIGRVISNIVSNAVKYTEKGVITFSVECEPLDEDGYMLSVYVKDTGKGIKEADIPKLFDPFYRSDINKNRSLDGTGLGLSIAKDFVDKMGGEILVESIYGRGSTFVVRIPQKKAISTDMYNQDVMSEFVKSNTREEDSEEIDKLANISPDYVAPELRVLAVDDNSSNLVVIREFLRGTEAQVDLIASGQEAIDICNVNQYDIILMDHMMPEPDGIEAMHKIKDGISSLNRKTPIIVLTANTVGDCRCQYLKEGFDNYLSKPVVRDVLLKMIRYYVPKKLIKEKNPTELEALAVSTDKEEIEQSTVIDFVGLGKRFDNQPAVIDMVLAECVKEGLKKLQLLREVYESGDIPRYAVEAHGVKGVMASICANDISARAKLHEFAGKENNVDFIRDDIDGFLEEYESVLNYIEKHLEKHGVEVKKPVKIEKKAGEGVSVEELVYQIEEALDEFDADKALKIIEELEATVSEDKRSIVDEVKQYADDFQYDLAKESLAKI